MSLLKSNFTTVVFIFLILFKIAVGTEQIPECRFTGTCTINYLEKEKDANGNTIKKTLKTTYDSGKKTFDDEKSEIMKKSTAILNDVALEEFYSHFGKSVTILSKENGRIIKTKVDRKNRHTGSIERILNGSNKITENSDDESDTSFSTEATSSGDEKVEALSTKASDRKLQPIHILNLKEEFIIFDYNL
jgi:hypothetical protein